MAATNPSQFTIAPWAMVILGAGHVVVFTILNAPFLLLAARIVLSRKLRFTESLSISFVTAIIVVAVSCSGWGVLLLVAMVAADYPPIGTIQLIGGLCGLVAAELFVPALVYRSWLRIRFGQAMFVVLLQCGLWLLLAIIFAAVLFALVAVEFFRSIPGG